MLTPKAKEKQNVDKIERGIQICEEALAKAEKYERLKDNKDWQGYISDLKVLAELHDREIKMGQAMLVDAPSNGYVMTEFDKQKYVSSKSDWVDFIVRHQIQKAEAEKWAKEPDQIISFAATCREKLPVLKKQLEDMTVGSESENGKS